MPYFLLLNGWVFRVRVAMYDGDWIDGQMTGNGTYLWSNGMKYIGDWVNGQMHGKGKLISVDGNVSEGNFSLGKLVN